LTPISEVVTDVCGVIAIGPFGCMPNRLSEAILSDIMNPADKLASDPHNRKLRATLENVEDLPFLSIESDGSPFPQLTRTKLEAFCLRAQRLHHRIQGVS
jgi:predicted nucleotide-binding protein (sugar kinase/HSP70/actin superfamily)